MTDAMHAAVAAIEVDADDEDALYRTLALHMKSLERNPAVAGAFAPATIAPSELGITVPDLVAFGRNAFLRIATAGQSADLRHRVQPGLPPAADPLDAQHRRHDGDRGGRDPARRPARDRPDDRRDRGDDRRRQGRAELPRGAVQDVGREARSAATTPTAPTETTAPTGPRSDRPTAPTEPTAPPAPPAEPPTT